MLLTIRTLSCPPPDNPQNIHAKFDAAGGRIGRSQPCKLILPDPNRHISREHAEIRLRDNAFSIKVVSKVNSLLVNDAVVGPGEAVDLKHGDRVLIGEYLLQADISAAASTPAASPFAAPPANAPAANPFDVFDNLAAGNAKAPPPAVPDWFQSSTPAAAPPPTGAASELDDFFNPTPENSRFNDLLKDNKPTAPPPPQAPAAAPVDHRLDDFLGLGSATDLEPSSDPFGKAASDLYQTSPLDLPLSPTSHPSKQSSPVPASPPPAAAPAFPDDDIFKALEQDFASPPVAPPFDFPPPVQPPPAQATPASPAAPVAPTPVIAAPVVAPPADLPVMPPPPPVQPGAMPDPGLEAALLPTPAKPIPPAAAPGAASARAAPAPAVAQPFVAAVPVASPLSDDRTQHLMEVLAEGLGLKPGDIDTSNPEQTIRIVGELLRMSTDGLFRMLEMRSQLKSELHIEDRTMIASRENNPLKHADSPHDAIAYLVDLRQHGNRLFMPPGKAVEDTIWDICAHEMAVMAGTRAALLAALQMFAPDVIEGRIKKTGALENVLPALHKSRLWERFLDMYAQLQHEAEDHFDRLLNQEFSRAYSDQSKKLKKKR